MRLQLWNQNVDSGYYIWIFSSKSLCVLLGSLRLENTDGSLVFSGKQCV